MTKTKLNLTHADLDNYDAIIVGFSGGKDSVACVLSVLETRPDLKSKVVLWHHHIDGVDHDRPTTFETDSYNRGVPRNE